MVIEHISIDDMVADQLTKGLTAKLFNEHMVIMGVLSSYDILGQWAMDFFDPYILVVNFCNQYMFIATHVLCYILSK